MTAAEDLGSWCRTDIELSTILSMRVVWKMTEKKSERRTNDMGMGTENI